MKITFACPHCGKPLVADTAFAGRNGRCRSCGHRAVVPGGPVDPGGSGASGGPRQTAPRTGAPAADWRTAVASQLPTPAGSAAATRSRGDAGPAADSGYKLRPVTPVGVPALDASDWGNAELGPAIVAPVTAALTTPVSAGPARPRAVSKRPAVAQTRQPAGWTQGTDSVTVPGTVLTVLRTIFGVLVGVIGSLAGRSAASGSSSVVVAYRSFFGLLGRWTAWISETSYTVSFIIIILAVASGMIGRHSLAALGCGAIVALNLVGLAGDLTSLVTLSFRKNPLQGTLFLVPPFTLYYLWSDWQRYRDTVVRMRTPLVTLAAVAAAYVFVPWLHGGTKEEGRIVAAVKRAVDTVEESVAGRKDALDDGLKKARTWLRDVPVPDPSSLPGLPDTLKPAHGHKP